MFRFYYELRVMECLESAKNDIFEGDIAHVVDHLSIIYFYFFQIVKTMARRHVWIVLAIKEKMDEVHVFLANLGRCENLGGNDR